MNSQQYIIGCVLTEPDKVLPVCIEHGFRPEMLTGRSRLAYETAMSLWRSGHGVDIATVDVAMGKQGLRNLTVFLGQCVDAVTTVEHLNDHVEIVTAEYRRKALEEAIARAQRELKDAEQDSNEIATTLSQRIVAINADTTKRVKSLGDYRGPKVQQWKDAKEGTAMGVPSSLVGLNRAMGGYRPEIMTIIAGYRGEGKSTFVRQECLSIARANHGVALLSIEDPGDQAAASIVCNFADASTFDLDVGKSNAMVGDVDDAWKHLEALPLHIASWAMTIGDVEATCAMLRHKENIEIVFLDHLQFITPYRLPTMNRNDTISTYSRTLTDMAKRFHIPVVVTSQLSRDSEKQNRKPRLSDLRDSGSIEQDARAVLMLYYEGESHVIEIAKQNYGPSRVKIPLRRVLGKRFEET